MKNKKQIIFPNKAEIQSAINSIREPQNAHFEVEIKEPDNYLLKFGFSLGAEWAIETIKKLNSYEKEIQTTKARG